ncbi:L,D-transpeptidase [Hyphomicrobiales bacterium BP6-180914]|uniref:L,D-transpeptidase n=2 Tax=Lichenifustis flavocetrariae TaxID=2949735 RepID=A0AA41Z2S2_9HYPH|nr:L,D-transpeptidase [Lichenifustis flavocetrariae]MCW6509458.1 L,D-transpeptidase [Lichenifustis flavocetrariae]
MGFTYRPVVRTRLMWTEIVLAGLIALATLGAFLTTVLPAGAYELAALPGYPPGTIVVSQRQRSLYLVVENGEALRYPVAVGKMGKQWRGVVTVDGKYVAPAWAPPPEVKRAEPWLPDYIPGGSPSNPMGARALTLSGDEYAIHGTNRPDSIGRAASFGCIRMHNRDIVDLFDRVAVGTPVVMLQ